MLEDQTIQSLISWSGSNESFVMSPSPEFSKVLAYVIFGIVLRVAADIGQAIFQTHQYLVLCASAEHVWLP